MVSDKITADGYRPSLLARAASALKLCSVVKVCAVTRSAGIELRLTTSTGRRNRFLMDVFMSRFKAPNQPERLLRRLTDSSRERYLGSVAKSRHCCRAPFCKRPACDLFCPEARSPLA